MPANANSSSGPTAPSGKGAEPRPLYYIRNKELDDTRALTINKTIADESRDDLLPNARPDIPLTMEAIEDTWENGKELDGPENLSVLWYFRPLNTSTELQGSDIPWTIHNVLKCDAWDVSSVDRGDAYYPGLLLISIAGDFTTVWKVQVPIG